MFIGHFGVGLGLKATAPKTSLGTLAVLNHRGMAAHRLGLFGRRTPQRPINSPSFIVSAHGTKNLKPPPTFH
ncbi:MAG TPA: hypothetical protein EYG11_04745 [Candidatus Latescibacteria bacterium]|nr:hypothetical protein [Candidatus Handelsmanbacteria bacterium]HIL07987.1 hypothetical protein [Candidatus Latescibacterota bacterium]